MRPFDTIRLRSTGSLGAADLELSDGSVRFSRAAMVYAGGLSGFAGEHSQHCGPSPLSEKKMHGAHFLSPSRKQGNSQTKRSKHGARTAFPSVGIGDFRCRLHVQCLRVPREVPRQTVFR